MIKNQWYILANTDLLITPNSGLNMMTSLGIDKVIYHNSTNFLLALPVPTNHLFIPKRLIPSISLINSSNLSRTKIISWLIEDIAFNPYAIKFFNIKECSFEELN